MFIRDAQTDSAAGIAGSARHDQRLLDRHRNDLILYNADALTADALHQQSTAFSPMRDARMRSLGSRRASALDMTQDGGASGEAGVQAHFFGKLMHIRDLFGNHDDRMTLLLDQIQIAKGAPGPRFPQSPYRW